MYYLTQTHSMFGIDCPLVGKSELVRCERNVKANLNYEPNVIVDTEPALRKDGYLETDSGTVSVSLSMPDGRAVARDRYGRLRINPPVPKFDEESQTWIMP